MAMNSKAIGGVAITCIVVGIAAAALSLRGEPRATADDLTAIIEAKSDDALVVEWRAWSEKIALAEQQGADERSMTAMNNNRDRIAQILERRGVDPETHIVNEQTLLSELDD